MKPGDTDFNEQVRAVARAIDSAQAKIAAALIEMETCTGMRAVAVCIERDRDGRANWASLSIGGARV